jgi:hypothetical protein
LLTVQSISPGVGEFVRGPVARALRRYRDDVGDELADTIDLCTLYPETRRKVVRLLAEIDAKRE